MSDTGFASHSFSDGWVLGAGLKVFKDPILIPGIKGCFIGFPSREGHGVGSEFDTRFCIHGAGCRVNKFVYLCIPLITDI